MKRFPANTFLRLRKASIVGLLIGILGVNIVPLAHQMEESIGLHLLFKLRGPRPAPAEVVIVNLDKASAEHLNVEEEPRKWPRTLHGRLVDSLSRQGAAVIAFDILFDEIRSPADNRSFAQALQKAGNVILCERIQKEKITLTGPAEDHPGYLNIVRRLPPIPVLAESAAGLAPFPLPKVPVKVSQYWTFKSGAGDTPTLPVVAFQIFALDVYDDFMRLLKKFSPSHAADLPGDRHEMFAARTVEKSMRSLRDVFESQPSIGKKMLAAIQTANGSPAELRKTQTLASLITMYLGANSSYLNFYGPPGTISTVSYFQALQSDNRPGGGTIHPDFYGKAVFVGLSELTRPEQKDGFYTTFSQESGINISGVEIAATAFANLLEDMPVRPLDFRTHLAAVFLWGFMLGLLCLLLPTGIAAVNVVGLGALYLIAGHYQFKSTGIWLPLVVPLFFQVPIAIFAALVWKYIRTNKERQHIRKAFGYYLPDSVVDQVVRNISDIKTSRQLVYGTCLCTDAEKYTTLSETMEPEKLSRFMNRYYEAIFEPVRRRGGIVSDVIGDSMLAIWASGHPDATLRHQSCLTALDIAKAVNRFNRSSPGWQLPTRIGLHSGRMMLGNIGAIDHYEYRAVGDVVNSASRLEGLNKHLGTQIIVSEAVLHQLDGLLARPLGKFYLAGKSNPIGVHELVCRLEESSAQQRSLCAIFDEALGAYSQQSWQKAIKIFEESMKIFREDGPSFYYLRLCEQYLKHPPEEEWDGSIRLANKG